MVLCQLCSIHLTSPPRCHPLPPFLLVPPCTFIARYDAGDAAFVANVGTLIEPIADKTEYHSKTKRIPKSLGAHNVQTVQTQNVHAGSLKTKGILGRIMEAITGQPSPYATGGYSLNGNVKAFQGDRHTDILNRNSGVVRWDG